MSLNILILGPQGSGKGTQAKRTAAEYSVPHIATGDMLREAIAAGTELGRRVKPIYDAGGLVPDDLMIALIRDRLSRSDTRDGFVLDGFPRTLGQAQALDAMLEEIGRRLDVILLLQVPEEVSTERMLGRAKLEGRSDDTPQAIRKRLELYFSETEPVVAHYQASGKVIGIHAERSIEAVFAEIQDALERAVAR